MAFEQLLIGPVYTLSQNTVYAMPGRPVVKIRSSANVESSMDGTTFAAVTLTNNEAECSAPFIRTTTASAIVTLRRLG